MADGTAIGFHNALKDSVDAFLFIDAVCLFATDAAGSCLGDATAGTDVLLLVTSQADIKLMHYDPVNFF